MTPAQKGGVSEESVPLVAVAALSSGRSGLDFGVTGQ
jgi:hypothetical protein